MAGKSPAFSLPALHLKYPKLRRCQRIGHRCELATGEQVERTAHEFRHTMAGRLRDAGYPTAVRHSIGGWATKREAAGYAKGYSFPIKREWLGKAVG
ncbi:hypothetical protein DF030_17690 [Burkholderia cenocepacia]|nr:hypothetical protein DF040_18630 [Burkholderia cenocepacia]RQV22795.1 hypothetical protein DF030_17690 [Burkholderia cenocepacia]